ncbi:hypothetical protein FKM82_018300, partial [Ascaphus truei]
VNCEDEVRQSPPTADVSEGDMSVMTCEYVAGSFYSLQWYKQNPGERPRILHILRSSGNFSDNKCMFELQKEEKRSFLYISNSESSDTGTYWCALEAQCEKTAEP